MALLTNLVYKNVVLTFDPKKDVDGMQLSRKE